MYGVTPYLFHMYGVTPYLFHMYGATYYLHKTRVAAERFITYFTVKHARVTLHVLRQRSSRLVKLLTVLKQNET